MSNARDSANDDDGFAVYLFEYGHKGARWGIEVRATDPEDAKDRIRALAFAQYRGEVVAKIPVPRLRTVLAPFRSFLNLLSARG